MAGFALRPSVPEVEPHARRSAEAGRVKVTVQGQAVLDLTLGLGELSFAIFAQLKPSSDYRAKES